MYRVLEETKVSRHKIPKKRPGGLGCPPGQIFDGRCVLRRTSKKLGISSGDSAYPKAGNDRLHILLVLFEDNQPQVTSCTPTEAVFQHRVGNKNPLERR